MNTTIEHAIKIYKSDVPGLLQLNNLGNYGEYILHEIVYADLCQLWGFRMFVHSSIPDNYKFVPVYEDGEQKDDIVEVYRMELSNRITTYARRINE